MNKKVIIWGGSSISIFVGDFNIITVVPVQQPLTEIPAETATPAGDGTKRRFSAGHRKRLHAGESGESGNAEGTPAAEQPCC